MDTKKELDKRVALLEKKIVIKDNEKKINTFIMM